MNYQKKLILARKIEDFERKLMEDVELAGLCGPDEKIVISTIFRIVKITRVKVTTALDDGYKSRFKTNPDLTNEDWLRIENIPWRPVHQAVLTLFRRANKKPVRSRAISKQIIEAGGCQADTIRWLGSMNAIFLKHHLPFRIKMPIGSGYLHESGSRPYLIYK